MKDYFFFLGQIAYLGFNKKILTCFVFLKSDPQIFFLSISLFFRFIYYYYHYYYFSFFLKIYNSEKIQVTITLQQMTQKQSDQNLHYAWHPSCCFQTHQSTDSQIDLFKFKNKMVKSYGVLILTFCMLGKNFSRWHFEIYFLLYPENRIWQSCKYFKLLSNFTQSAER